MLLGIVVSCQNTSSYPVWTETDRQYLIDHLNETQLGLHHLVDSLTEDQWKFLPEEETWNIMQIVEHLQLQEDMHYREVYVVSMQPPLKDESLKTIGNDEKVEAYADSGLKTIADWNVTPMDRWQSKAQALEAFDRSRSKLLEFIRTTDRNLRQQITFRRIQDASDFRRVRNLHQIILTTIAHTKRHIAQIERLTKHPDFPT